MRRSLLQILMPVAGVLSVVFAAARPAAAQSIQLADGQVLLASVEDYDGEMLRIRRLDNGGVLDLRWDQLSPASSTTWKRKLNLLGDGDDELMARAVQVTFESAGARQTVIGRIDDRGADPIVVAVKGNVYSVPRRDLRHMTELEVPATQLYTLDEFYQLRLGEIAPGEQADKHLLLAEDLIKFQDYDHAAQHLEQARTLGNSKNPGFIDTLSDRLTRFKEAAKELGLIDRIRASSFGKLNEFAKGRELIAQFEKEFPQTRLRKEYEREKQRFEERRSRYLTQQVTELWRNSISTVAGKKVTEDGLTLQAARDYAEEKMTDDIVSRLQTILKLEAEEIRAMWSDRAKYTAGKRAEHFTYGIGSWVLGEAALLKDTATGDAKQAQQETSRSGQDPNIERFMKQLEEALRKRQRAQAGDQQNQEMTDEDWWREASRGERISWLRAYYAEFSGQLKVTLAMVSPCISCGGKGTTAFIGGDGKPQDAKCFLCQGNKWQRSFKAY